MLRRTDSIAHRHFYLYHSYGDLHWTPALPQFHSSWMPDHLLHSRPEPLESPSSSHNLQIESVGDLSCQAFTQVGRDPAIQGTFVSTTSTLSLIFHPFLTPTESFLITSFLRINSLQKHKTSPIFNIT